MPPLLVAQLSDCHLFADRQRCGYAAINPYDNLQRVLTHVAEQQPDLLLLSGDMSGDGSVASYQHLYQLLHHCLPNVPVYMIPGNHDDRALMEQQFAAAQLWFSGPVVRGKWAIHGIDSKSDDSTGQVDAVQLQALTDQLANTPCNYHLLMVHHHPVPFNSWVDQHGWQQPELFISWLAQQLDVQAVVFGHVHGARHQVVVNVPMWSCPSTCWQWLHQPEFGVDHHVAGGYRLMRLYNDGQITTEVQLLNPI